MPPLLSTADPGASRYALFERQAIKTIQARLASRPETVVIVDDDPTGTQAFHNMPVLFSWQIDTLIPDIENQTPGLFITTNSRGLPEAEAVRINREIGVNVRTAEVRTGTRCQLVSRSDSTLRGHFPAELDALIAGYGAPIDAILFAPFFHDGGRITRDDNHYIRKDGIDTLAADTEFARDPAFGYSTSHLPSWIEEKTAGRISVHTVLSISLNTIRTGGSEAVAEKLLSAQNGIYCVINAETPADMVIAVAGSLIAEEQGRRFVWRCAASAPQARLGQNQLQLLDETQLPPASRGRGGLVIIGSHVPTTTRQLATLVGQTTLVTAIEADAKQLAGPSPNALIIELARQIDELLKDGRNVALFTSRQLTDFADRADYLAVGQRIGDGLIAILQAIQQQPAYLIVKGGITSHRIAHEGLRFERAIVRGALFPGVPVWQCSHPSRWPGLTYVVFPGNVGSNDALLRAVQRLSHL